MKAYKAKDKKPFSKYLLRKKPKEEPE